MTQRGDDGLTNAVFDVERWRSSSVVERVFKVREESDRGVLEVLEWERERDTGELGSESSARPSRERDRGRDRDREL